MASISTTLSVSASSLIDNKTLRHAPIASSPQCVTLPTLAGPSMHCRIAPRRRKIARNVVALTTGDVPSETETPEIVKTVLEAWEKVEDKYAVTSIAFAGAVALWGSSGLISAIDKLPLVPGVLELVGIGYTGWFSYKNLFFQPDREVLLQKVKDAYKDVLGSS
ncbi:hypothetical protein GIB67_034618 [Kingdonia uniflora]|uniref:Cyanobacterial aminoacyl-tRNA synthetase CAAD domain-containing protein n=1 Tax=Kingdonia uniflora TaxID=39325 RepID=A0A7J7MXQ8_9MAGN|nr:hypothetical protein GIB67_034618 [Kingdonia uniflora]